MFWKTNILNKYKPSDCEDFETKLCLYYYYRKKVINEIDEELSLRNRIKLVNYIADIKKTKYDFSYKTHNYDIWLNEQELNDYLEEHSELYDISNKIDNYALQKHNYAINLEQYTILNFPIDEINSPFCDSLGETDNYALYRWNYRHATYDDYIIVLSDKNNSYSYFLDIRYSLLYLFHDVIFWVSTSEEKVRFLHTVNVKTGIEKKYSYFNDGYSTKMIIDVIRDCSQDTVHSIYENKDTDELVFDIHRKYAENPVDESMNFEMDYKFYLSYPEMINGKISFQHRFEYPQLDKLNEIQSSYLLCGIAKINVNVIIEANNIDEATNYILNNNLRPSKCISNNVQVEFNYLDPFEIDSWSTNSKSIGNCFRR